MDKVIEKDFDVLREAVEDLFDVPLRERTRKRTYVNARFVFSNILVARGHTKVNIAKYLGMDHATIVHYCRNFYGFTQADSKLKRNYEELDKVFSGQFNPLYKLDREQLRERVIELEQKIRKLNKKREMDEAAFKKAIKKEERLKELWDLISLRVPSGKEAEAKKKINTVLNGLHG